MKFSVLLSVYNKENPSFLRQALQSIYEEQTLKPNECVIVKDGPLTKELDDVLFDYKNKYPEIFKTIPLNENQGLGNALRIGAEVCKYNFIARMDADDLARPSRFEKQMEFMSLNPNIDVVGSNIEEFNVIPGDLNRYKINPEYHEELIQRIKLRSPFNHPSIIMRKETLIRAGNYNTDLLLFEDYSLFLRMWLAGAKFYNIQEVLLDFRVGSGIETIKRRSGKHYIQKEMKFIKYAKDIGAFNKLDVLMYKCMKFPIRKLPPKIVLYIYNTLLRDSK